MAKSDPELNADEIAHKVEQEIRALARKWKREHPKTRSRRTGAEIHQASIPVCAWHLHEHIDWYLRQNHQATRDAHERWLTLMTQWFMTEV